MYNNLVLPHIVYTVTMLDHTSHDYVAAQFHDKLLDDKFVKDIQMFTRCMWELGQGRPARQTLDQEPCLIVKKVVPEDNFDRFGCQSLYAMINENSHVYHPDHFMITYENLAEPIVKGTKLFDRTLTLQFPLTDNTLKVQKQMSSAENFCVSLAQLNMRIN